MTGPSLKSIWIEIAKGDPNAFERAAQMMKDLTDVSDRAADGYAAFIARVAKTDGASSIVLNRHAAHAAIVVEALFRHASNAVEILAGNLTVAVYGAPDIAEAVVNFLLRNPGARLSIIAEQPIYTELHPLFVVLRQAELLDRVTLRQMPTDIAAKLDCHFMVVDNRHYRFEPSRASSDAMVQFGNETFGKALHEMFSRLESLSELQSAERDV